MTRLAHGPITAGLGRRAAIAIAMAGALSVGSATPVHAADPRLTDADAALQKAAALVLAAEPGNVPPRAQRKFERHVARAVELIERARDEVQAAREAVDAEALDAALTELVQPTVAK